MTTTQTILIVDDENDVLDWLDNKLFGEHYIVLRASTAKEALEKAQKEKPHLILIDIMLPDMEGAQVVQILANDAAMAHIPVIFMSGIVAKEDPGARPQLNVGGRLYRALGKPFEFKEILAEIHKALAASSD